MAKYTFKGGEIQVRADLPEIQIDEGSDILDFPDDKENSPRVILYIDSKKDEYGAADLAGLKDALIKNGVDLKDLAALDAEKFSNLICALQKWGMVVDGGTATEFIEADFGRKITIDDMPKVNNNILQFCAVDTTNDDKATIRHIRVELETGKILLIRISELNAIN